MLPYLSYCFDRDRQKQFNGTKMIVWMYVYYCLNNKYMLYIIKLLDTVYIYMVKFKKLKGTYEHVVYNLK